MESSRTGVQVCHPPKCQLPQCRDITSQDPQAALSCTGGGAQAEYENKVLRPLLGGEHIHQGVYVQLPLGFAAILAQRYGLQLSQDAWIVRDHTLFQQRPALGSGVLLVLGISIASHNAMCSQHVSQRPLSSLFTYR